MKMRNVLNLAICLFLSLGVLGCGYTTHVYVAKSGFKTIYIAPFVNKVNTVTEFSEGKRFKSYFPLLENKITNAVVDRYIFDGNLKVVKEDEADLVLTGELVDYRRDSVRTSDDDTPQEYRITIFCNLTLTNAQSGEIEWQEGHFAGDATYFTTGSFTSSEAQALDEAAADFARRAVERTVEAW